MDLTALHHLRLSWQINWLNFYQLMWLLFLPVSDKLLFLATRCMCLFDNKYVLMYSCDLFTILQYSDILNQMASLCWCIFWFLGQHVMTPSVVQFIPCCTAAVVQLMGRFWRLQWTHQELASRHCLCPSGGIFCQLSSLVWTRLPASAWHCRPSCRWTTTKITVCYHTAHHLIDGLQPKWHMVIYLVDGWKPKWQNLLSHDPPSCRWPTTKTTVSYHMAHHLVDGLQPKRQSAITWQTILETDLPNCQSYLLYNSSLY